MTSGEKKQSRGRQSCIPGMSYVFVLFSRRPHYIEHTVDTYKILDLTYAKSLGFDWERRPAFLEEEELEAEG